MSDAEQKPSADLREILYQLWKCGRDGDDRYIAVGFAQQMIEARYSPKTEISGLHKTETSVLPKPVDGELRESIARIAHKIMYPNQYVRKSFSTIADMHKVVDDAKDELLQLFTTNLQAAVREAERKAALQALMSLDIDTESSAGRTIDAEIARLRNKL